MALVRMKSAYARRSILVVSWLCMTCVTRGSDTVATSVVLVQLNYLVLTRGKGTAIGFLCEYVISGAIRGVWAGWVERAIARAVDLYNSTRATLVEEMRNRLLYFLRLRLWFVWLMLLTCS